MFQVVNLRDSVDYYTSNSWILKADNSRELFLLLSKEDQEKFPCDPTEIVWSQYIKGYINGIYEHLEPETRKKSFQ